MQEGVAFASSGWSIVDEQHRFGVQQRLALRDKGSDGAQLRAASAGADRDADPAHAGDEAYADLDVSAIDELPPGRTPVQTVAVPNARGEVIERIRAACAEGRQVYWVCTLIEESEQLQRAGRGSDVMRNWRPRCRSCGSVCCTAA